MPNTPVYSFPYPALTDSPNGPTEMQSMALSIESTIQTLNSPTFTTYVPVWSGLGGGNVLTQTGRYMRLGKLCWMAATMTVSSGANLGTGAISCTLPFQAASPGNNQQWTGNGIVGGGPGYLIVATVSGGSNTAAIFANTNGAQNPGGAGDTWANGSYMTFNLWYETI